MRYLGKMTGHGVLKSNGAAVGRVSYEFDGFATLRKPAGVVAHGEIRMPIGGIGSALGLPNVEVQTDDGHLLALRFSDAAPRPNSPFANVDVTAGLPASSRDWSYH